MQFGQENGILSEVIGFHGIYNFVNFLSYNHPMLCGIRWSLNRGNLWIKTTIDNIKLYNIVNIFYRNYSEI